MSGGSVLIIMLTLNTRKTCKMRYHTVKWDLFVWLLGKKHWKLSNCLGVVT